MDIAGRGGRRFTSQVDRLLDSPGAALGIRTDGRREPARVSSDFSMAVTRMRGFSFLTVQGRVSRRRLRQFSQGLQYAMHFSPLPVVVDLRNVAFVHPRALRAIIHVWLSAPDPNLALEVLIKARPRARESLLVRL